jgi:Domain of unknown function (DUF4124)
MHASWRRSLRLGCAGSLLIAATTAQAEIYKWTDADGKVHYSENKAAAGQAKAATVQVRDRAPSAQEVEAARQAWQAQDRDVNRRLEKLQRKERQTAMPDASVRPLSVSGGKEHGTDASRCNLAQDVLKGALVHRNGKPIDQYDLDTARSDVKLFCR